MAKQPSGKRQALLPPPPLVDGFDDETHPRSMSGNTENLEATPTENSLEDSISASTWSVAKNEMLGESQLKQKLALSDAKPDQLPEISGYQVERILGEGGMGVVYLARDLKLDRLVAIKMLNDSAQHLRDRFATETRAVAALQHPNIAQLYAADECNDKPYYVMEYVDGLPLDQKLASKPQDPHTAAELVIVLARAMAYTHHQGLLHRDLKPSNVLIHHDGTPKIADFGLAKSYLADSSSTMTGEILGTPSYMAPEQASGITKQLNEACDVYGLGGILYKLLTGHAPFNSPDPMQTVLMVLREDPIAPRRLISNIPRDLENICLKCLSKSPSRRYATALDLANDLQRFVNGEPVQARSITLTERVGKWARRRPGAAAALASLVLLIALTIGGLLLYSQQLSEHSRELSRENDRYKRLLESNNRFSNWIAGEHLIALQQFKGSTRQRQLLAEKLQTHLDNLKQDAGDDGDYLSQLALSYESFADVMGNPAGNSLGETAVAWENYQRALELHRAANQIQPRNLATQRGLIGCLLKMSAVAGELKGIQKVIELVEEAEQRLKSIEDDLDFHTNVVQVMLLERKIAIHIQQQNFELVDQLLSELVTEAVPRLDQADRQDIYLHHKINALDMQGEMLRKQGDFEASGTVLKEVYELAQQRFEDHPENAFHQTRYIHSAIGYADTLIHLENNDRAVELYQIALNNRRRLAEADPDDQVSQRNLVVVLSRVSDGYILIQQYEDALVLQQEAVKLMRTLVDNEPENIGLRRDLAKQLTDLASCHVNLQKNESDPEAFQESLAYNLEQFAQAKTFQVEALGVLADLESRDPGNYGDIADRAFVYYAMAVNEFGTMMLNMEEVPITLNNKSYKESIRLLDSAIETLENLGREIELHQQQKDLILGFKDMKAHFEDAVKKMMATYGEDI